MRVTLVLSALIWAGIGGAGSAGMTWAGGSTGHTHILADDLAGPAAASRSPTAALRIPADNAEGARRPVPVPASGRTGLVPSSGLSTHAAFRAGLERHRAYGALHARVRSGRLSSPATAPPFRLARAEDPADPT